MEAKSVRITPKMAEQMLNKNTGNRKLRPGVVEKYSYDMRQGKWTKCTAPIAFYANGEIADGQHRLWAVVESKTAQTFLILKGLALEDGLNIDTGLGRTLVDNAKISGYEPELSHIMIGAARACEEGQRQSGGVKGTLSNAKKLEIVTKHEKAISWAMEHMPVKQYLRNSITLAAMARAWYHEPDKVRLAEFATVFASGNGNGMKDSAAIALRNYFLIKKGIASNPSRWKDTFHKTQNAIRNFMLGKEISKSKANRLGEIYPLPKAKLVVDTK